MKEYEKQTKEIINKYTTTYLFSEEGLKFDYDPIILSIQTQIRFYDVLGVRAFDVSPSGKTCKVTIRRKDTWMNFKTWEQESKIVSETFERVKVRFLIPTIQHWVEKRVDVYELLSFINRVPN